MGRPSIWGTFSEEDRLDLMLGFVENDSVSVIESLGVCSYDCLLDNLHKEEKPGLLTKLRAHAAKYSDKRIDLARAVANAPVPATVEGEHTATLLQKYDLICAVLVEEIRQTRESGNSRNLGTIVDLYRKALDSTLNAQLKLAPPPEEKPISTPDQQEWREKILHASMKRVRDAEARAEKAEAELRARTLEAGAPLKRTAGPQAAQDRTTEQPGTPGPAATLRGLRALTATGTEQEKDQLVKLLMELFNVEVDQ